MTVGSGKIVIKGVDLGEYTLTETKAPAGYNKLNGDKAFTVEAGNTPVSYTHLDVYKRQQLGLVEREKRKTA